MKYKGGIYSMKKDRHWMKRVFSMIMALAMIVTMMPVAAFAADTDTTVYLVPNSNWKADNARFAIYCFGKGEEWVDETSFFDVTVWGKPAEDLKSEIVKGSPVRVSGRLQQDRWQDQNGNNKSKIFIVADSVKVYPKEQKQNNSGNTSDFPEDFPWN
jgi:single stranded DNA-binding protein